MESASPCGRRENKNHTGDQAQDDLAQKLVLEVAQIPKLAESLLQLISTGEDHTIDERKEAILQSIVLRRALQRKSTVEDSLLKKAVVEEATKWIGNCLREHSNPAERKTKLACVTRFFQLLSTLGDDACAFSEHDGYDSKARNELLGSLSTAFDEWLPLVLELSDREVVQVADFNIIRDVLDEKLTKPLVMLIVLLDGIATAVVLGCYVSATILMAQHDDNISGLEAVLLVVAIVCALYIALREATQAWKMSGLGLFDSWRSDGSNMLDVFCVASVLSTSGVALLGSHGARSQTWFRILVVATSCSLWLEVLNFLKLLHKKTATFVLSIFQIFNDLREFILVLLLFVLMFTNAFYLLLSSAVVSSSDDTAAADDDDDDDGEEGDPFSTFGETLLTMYRMMLGDFERDWFSSKSETVAVVTVMLFIIFTFMVMVLLLNMLIAIISDSYDYAMIRAEQLFLQARIDLAAELVAVGVATSDAKDYAWIPNLRWFDSVFRFSRKVDDGEEDPDAHLFEEEWAGRALDQERRTKEAVQASKVVVLERIDGLEKSVEEIRTALAGLETRILGAIKASK